MRRYLVILGLFLSSVPARALFLAQTNEPFNPDLGIVEYNDAWAKVHRVGFMHGMGATAIAPHWIITAGHLQAQKIFDYKMGVHGNGSYHIVETVAHPNFPLVDLRLYRVKELLPDYATLAKAPGASNDVLTMYGRGRGAPYVPVKVDGQIIGWAWDKWRDGKEGLRSGTITNHGYTSHKEASLIKWYYGDGPLASYGDSGHPVFRGMELAGIIYAAPAPVYFRTGDTGPCTATGYVFDDSKIQSCTTPPSETRAWATAFNLASYLPWIYDTISPRLRIAAARNSAVEGWTNWSGTDGTFRETKEDIDLSNATNAAPQELYRSILFKRRGPIELRKTELLRTEHYIVRLHFSGIHFDKPGQVEQKITINGYTLAERFDPFAAPGGKNKATVLELKFVRPDKDDSITVNLTPASSGKSTGISGVEMFVQLP